MAWHGMLRCSRASASYGPHFSWTARNALHTPLPTKLFLLLVYCLHFAGELVGINTPSNHELVILAQVLGSADDIRAAMTFAGAILLLVVRLIISAARPAMCGVAMEVPCNKTFAVTKLAGICNACSAEMHAGFRFRPGGTLQP